MHKKSVVPRKISLPEKSLKRTVTFCEPHTILCGEETLMLKSVGLVILNRRQVHIIQPSGNFKTTKQQK